MMGFQPRPPTSGSHGPGSVMWGQCSQVGPDAGGPLGKGLGRRAGDLSQLCTTSPCDASWLK